MRRLQAYSLIAALVAALAVLAAGCGGRGAAKSGGEAFRPHHFPALPEPPAMVTEPREATEYVLSNYWNEFLSKSCPCDSGIVNGVPAEEVEKALGTYVTLLEQGAGVDFGRKAMAGFFDKVEKFQAADTSSNVFDFFEEMVPKYLYDPNSPVRNEDLYLPYVSGLAASAFVDPEMRRSYSYNVKLCSLNKIGTPAADFTFTDLSGKRRSLYGIKAETTLLFFTNPGCPACKEIIQSLTTDEVIPGLVASGRLAIVNVYIDEDIPLWRQYASEYPSSWYNGYDQSYLIRSDLIYDVRAIPSLYVLDGEKKVIMKDAPVEAVLPYLENL